VALMANLGSRELLSFNEPSACAPFEGRRTTNDDGKE
jgi:hypothetical protein